jgi:hypothetical protein
MSSFDRSQRYNEPGAFQDESVQYEEVRLGGRSFTIIPDPSPQVRARILLAIDAGRRAIIADPDIPELATRVLLGVEPSQRSQNPGFWFNRAFDSFATDVQEILESACSLREHDPQANILERLARNIAGLDHFSGNNLSISTAGVLIAEQLLDQSSANWRHDRDGSVFRHLPAGLKHNAEEALKSPNCGRDSEIDIYAKKLVGKMLRHLLVGADAQELLGEAGSLQMAVPAIIAPIKQAARIESQSC